MALISNIKGRRKNQSPSGYTRLFGIQALGQLMSRIQGTVISSGTELEKLIWERAQQVDDLDPFIERNRHASVDAQDRYWVASKPQIKKSQIISSQYEPDFLLFDLKNRCCYALEVKDGDAFDTKKSAGEHKTLHDFSTDVALKLPFTVKSYICAFNAATKDEAYNGLKKKFSKDEIILGKPLCDLLGIDFDEIVKIRTSDQQSNLDFFVNALLEIPPIKAMIDKRNGKNPTV